MYKRRNHVSSYQTFRNFSFLRKLTLIVLLLHVTWYIIDLIPNSQEAYSLERVSLDRPVKTDKTDYNKGTELEHETNKPSVEIEYNKTELEHVEKVTHTPTKTDHADADLAHDTELRNHTSAAVDPEAILEEERYVTEAENAHEPELEHEGKANNTSVETDLTSYDHEAALEHDEKVNLKYCGEKTCRFLFFIRIPEQETRANIHLRSLTYLARSLNRIMVLPNVGGSRMHCCLPFSFEFYYDLEKTKEMFPDVKFMTQRTFQEWTKELIIKPDALHAYFIEDGRNDIFDTIFQENPAITIGQRYNESFFNEMCLGQFDLNITKYIEVHAGTNFNKKQPKPYIEKMKVYVTENLQSDSPVILVRNHCLRQIVPVVDTPIPYAPHIIKEAARMRDQLRPYFCIHWRMEQGDPEQMPQCAKKLIKTIKKINQTEGINKVYLATDYPISGGKPASDSFLNLGRQHRRAIQILNDTLEFNTWVSMDAFKIYRDDEKYNSEFTSSGVHGILDKLMCTHADYFLSGPKGCCRILSTYTRLIGEARQHLLESGAGIRNAVTRW